MAKTIGILFPNGTATSTFGTWVLAKNHKLVLYRPGGRYKDMTRSIVLDLQLQAEEHSRLKSIPNDLVTVHTREATMDQCDYIVVPNMDILPSKQDGHYSDLCMNTFR